VLKTHLLLKLRRGDLKGWKFELEWGFGSRDDYHFHRRDSIDLGVEDSEIVILEALVPRTVDSTDEIQSTLVLRPIRRL